MRTIKVSFIITTSEIPIDVLAERIGLSPFNTMADFPTNSIAQPCWWVELVSDSLCVEAPLNELICILKPRQDELRKIAGEISLPPTLQVMVDTDYADRPEITFTPDILSFLSQLGAEICIEVNYLDEAEIL